MTERVDGRKLRYVHRRGEMLRAATEHALDHGLEDLTLRKVAQAVGVSHATLVHHFTTKEQLITEIVEGVLAETLAVPDLPLDHPDPLREVWRRATGAEGRRHIKLFAAIIAQAVYGDPVLRKAVASSMRQRTQLIADGLVLRGCPRTSAQPIATSVLATVRGLLVDLITTGDEERVNAAFEDAVTELERRLAELPGQGA
ncbi:TetR/AcrR family transcriptional regulator [Saccharopolyspora hirsuta]|uniref:TetR/AcrR family transcriptional regulator n=1 Tax=Saccharopolyspora hirsuta TaxID=1837 RepID=UPI0033330BC2